MTFHDIANIISTGCSDQSILSMDFPDFLVLLLSDEMDGYVSYCHS
jgi:hypothetical protein